MHGSERMDGVGADHTLGLLGYGELQPVPALNNHTVSDLNKTLDIDTTLHATL